MLVSLSRTNTHLRFYGTPSEGFGSKPEIKNDKKRKRIPIQSLAHPAFQDPCEMLHLFHETKSHLDKNGPESTGFTQSFFTSDC